MRDALLRLQAATATAPALLVDWWIHDTARPMPGPRLRKVDCTNFNLILNLCSVVFVAPSNAGEITRAVSYAFIGPPQGRFTVHVLADPAYPGWATTDLAIAHLVNRTICLAVFVPSVLMMTIGGLLGAAGVLRPRS